MATTKSSTSAVKKGAAKKRAAKSGVAAPNEETFFDPTRIVLFGKRFNGLSVQQAAIARAAGPAPGAAASPLRAAIQNLASGASVARIFSFSYEGYYQKLPWPMLFVVSGPGIAPSSTPSVA